VTVTQGIMGAATVTATYVRRGKRFRVFIRPAAGRRLSRSVKTEADAIALVRHFNRLGLAGVDLGKALRKTKAAPAAAAKSYPAIRVALPEFLDEMVAIGEIRQSTAKGYKNRLAVGHIRRSETPPGTTLRVSRSAPCWSRCARPTAPWPASSRSDAP
jgi:hypothetical protein